VVLNPANWQNLVTLEEAQQARRGQCIRLCMASTHVLLKPTGPENTTATTANTSNRSSFVSSPFLFLLSSFLGQRDKDVQLLCSPRTIDILSCKKAERQAFTFGQTKIRAKRNTQRLELSPFSSIAGELNCSVPLGQSTSSRAKRRRDKLLLLDKQKFVQNETHSDWNCHLFPLLLVS